MHVAGSSKLRYSYYDSFLHLLSGGQSRGQAQVIWERDVPFELLRVRGCERQAVATRETRLEKDCFGSGFSEQGSNSGIYVHSSHRHSQHRSHCHCTGNTEGLPAWRVLSKLMLEVRSTRIWPRTQYKSDSSTIRDRSKSVLFFRSTACTACTARTACTACTVC
eukprot:scpid44709/ scgid2791/ 